MLVVFSCSFLKVGNSPKSSPTETDGNGTMQANGSWRQTILNRVVTPNKDLNAKEIEEVGNISIIKSSETPVKRRTKQELRDLWKKAINQQLILIRMEKENAKLRGKQRDLIYLECIFSRNIHIYITCIIYVLHVLYL